MLMARFLVGDNFTGNEIALQEGCGGVAIVLRSKWAFGESAIAIVHFLICKTREKISKTVSAL